MEQSNAGDALAEKGMENIANSNTKKCRELFFNWILKLSLLHALPFEVLIRSISRFASIRDFQAYFILFIKSVSLFV